MKDPESIAGSTDRQPQTLMTTSSETARSWKVDRRWRWPLLGLVIAAFFAMGHVAGAFQKEQEMLRFKSISAEAFEVRGPDNKLKATLSHGRRGEAFLSFFDQDGRPRLSLGIGADGSPIISFLNNKQMQGMSFSIDSHDDTPGIALFDGNNETALSLGIIKGFGPSVSVGKRGHGRISISVTKEGSPDVEIVDQKENPRVSMSVIDGAPSISLLGEGRVVRSAWRVLPDGSVSFSLSDPRSRQRLIVMTDKEGMPFIRFLDPDGNVSREIKWDGK